MDFAGFSFRSEMLFSNDSSCFPLLPTVAKQLLCGLDGPPSCPPYAYLRWRGLRARQPRPIEIDCGDGGGVIPSCHLGRRRASSGHSRTSFFIYVMRSIALLAPAENRSGRVVFFLSVLPASKLTPTSRVLWC